MNQEKKVTTDIVEPIFSIHNIDNLNPEDNAMLQAKYSRSHESVISSLRDIDNNPESAGKFMEKFYVGYNHKSIGDCGSITLYIENVSILAAKAIQHNPLYRGTESSTRYLDFTERDVINPFIGMPEYAKNPIGVKMFNKITILQQKLIDFTNRVSGEAERYLRELNPKPNDISNNQYENAIKAKAFDMARGWLPAGVTTQLSWHTDIRQANDNIDRLITHPLQEVRNIGFAILDKLMEKYPTSFKDRDMENNRFKYLRKTSIREHYNIYDGLDKESFFKYSDTGFRDALCDDLNDVLESRPKYTEMAKFMNDLGGIKSRIKIDYGCARDLLRHRSLKITPTILTPDYGFNQYYLAILDFNRELYMDGNLLLAEIIDLHEDTIMECYSPNDGIDIVDMVLYLQYLMPLGFNVLLDINGGISNFIYMLELRNGITVHPNIIKASVDLADKFRNDTMISNIYVDNRNEVFTNPYKVFFQRGKQTIVKRDENISTDGKTIEYKNRTN